MSLETVLFDGTWEEALQHAYQIPKVKRIRIVEAESEIEEEKERYRALFAELIAEADSLKELEEAEGSEIAGSLNPDYKK